MILALKEPASNALISLHVCGWMLGSSFWGLFCLVVRKHEVGSVADEQERQERGSVVGTMEAVQTAGPVAFDDVIFVFCEFKRDLIVLLCPRQSWPLPLRPQWLLQPLQLLLQELKEIPASFLISLHNIAGNA